MSAARTSDEPRAKIPLAVLLAVAGTFALLWVLSPGLRSDLGRIGVILGGLDAAGLRDWLLSFGAFSPAVYFLAVVAQVIAAPIPSPPLTLVGALVFGVWEGLTLSMAGSVVGSVLVFATVRRWGEPLVVRLVGKQAFHRYAGRLDDGGWWLFVILLLPFLPDDAVCALAGLSALSFRRFFAVMVAGRLPGTTLTALLASDAVTGSAAAWISVGVAVVVLLALGFAYRARLEGWVFRRTGDEPADGSVPGDETGVEGSDEEKWR